MKLGYNEIMITSMYFNDINDFINLEMGVKRFQGNMERFHFNPIPLNEYSRKLFPNIETFHIYNRSDEIFNDGKIFKYVIWYYVDYWEYLQEKEKGDVYKNIIYTNYDRKKYGNTIPPEVTILGYECFNGCSSLSSITMPMRIKELGPWCFSGCTSLKSINIPTTISKIGDECFSYCSSLTSISIDNLQFVSEERIFINGPVLNSIKTPLQLKQINGKNIEKKDINEFTIPPTITKLGNSCFNWCAPLKSINIHSTISELGNRCFEGCSSLTSITIPTTISELGNECFKDCYSLTSIDLPTSVMKLGDRCFKYCTLLTSITISTTVSTIGIECFYGCKALTNMEIKGLKFISEDRIFVGEEKLVSIDIGKLIKINGKEIKRWDVNKFVIPTTIKEIGDYCFSKSDKLKSISIPSSVSKLGMYCFSGCSSLTSVILPSSTISFGWRCFTECNKVLHEIKRIPIECFESDYELNEK
ncbi:hypothetical protein, conserved [Entamoeba dispar SAW760]|uniref:Leucine rich repeat containing protein BspA family protein n=1 Tax=Entamoeba dispar (strain ATCC PRA-260 / SAW760) TaxID=370354 RepID=B0EP95_ENTDS|nr:uncharacterized protein EDI_237530 [Entamoeba dispar SAW760]EDR23666.1 hypothetical protein, conserved [Entamoeba dispar SAW760]|eukprot:EDR23666.1 hypothetical protein, conserved [Entamoeba dispar SAW760]